MFLTKDDYSVVCEETELDVITQNDATRGKAERTAMEEIASYLRTRYDIKKAFATIGDDRNPMLVQITVNIVLFYTAFWLPQFMAMDGRRELYDDAIAWLKEVQKGKATPDLPIYENESGTSNANPLRFGSQARTNYDY